MIRRSLAVGSIALTGLLLVAGAVRSTGAASDGVAALALVALGAVLGVAIAAAAVYLYRSDVRTSHTARIAGWNALGVALLGVIMLLAGTAPGVSIPGYVVVDVLGVSSVAHVLIGYNDVRRIRAQELAQQRRTLAVVNRLTRHNLRNRTQVLTGHASLLVDGAEDDGTREAAETVQRVADDLADVHGELAVIQDALNDEAPEGSVDLRSVIEDVLAPYRETYPEGTFEVDVPAGTAVRGDDQLTTALDHLVENAVEHGSEGDPAVTVTAERDGDGVTVSVRDRGAGMADHEVDVLTERSEISQLEHGSGLGLWVVKTVADRYGSDFDIDTGESGTTVRLDLQAA